MESEVTTIIFMISAYPAFVNERPALFDGFAEITLGELLGLPIQVGSQQPTKPLQNALRWSINRISLNGLADSHDMTDAGRFVRGRHWPQIDRLLYAEFLTEVGLHSYAEVYRHLA
jgi:hypothetical protein